MCVFVYIHLGGLDLCGDGFDGIAWRKHDRSYCKFREMKLSLTHHTFLQISLDQNVHYSLGFCLFWERCSCLAFHALVCCSESARVTGCSMHRNTPEHPNEFCELCKVLTTGHGE